MTTSNEATPPAPNTSAPGLSSNPHESTATCSVSGFPACASLTDPVSEAATPASTSALAPTPASGPAPPADSHSQDDFHNYSPTQTSTPGDSHGASQTRDAPSNTSAISNTSSAPETSSRSTSSNPTPATTLNNITGASPTTAMSDAPGNVTAAKPPRKKAAKPRKMAPSKCVPMF